MIVNYFHNLILSWFPYGTNHYYLHFVVMAAISLLIYAYFMSWRKTFWLNLCLCIFIELDQLITNTGDCEFLDILAGQAGCVIVLIIIDFINIVFKIPKEDSIIEEMSR